MTCPSSKRISTDKLQYKRKSLLDFFINFNECSNPKFVNSEKTSKRDNLNITLKPRFNNIYLSTKNSSALKEDLDFGTKSSFGLGVEFEFILPYNKNKWSFVFEPTVYQKYQNEQAKEIPLISGGNLVAKANYNSVELPVGLRHYFYLSTRTTIFLNASYVISFSPKSYVEFDKIETNRSILLEIRPRPSFAFGLGIKHGRVNAEVRYYTSKELFREFDFRSDYKVISLIFGYSFFQN